MAANPTKLSPSPSLFPAENFSYDKELRPTMEVRRGTIALYQREFDISVDMMIKVVISRKTPRKKNECFLAKGFTTVALCTVVVLY